MNYNKEKETAEWNFLITFIKVFDASYVGRDEEFSLDWWISNDCPFVDIDLWHPYRHKHDQKSF